MEFVYSSQKEKAHAEEMAYSDGTVAAFHLEKRGSNPYQHGDPDLRDAWLAGYDDHIEVAKAELDG